MNEEFDKYISVSLKNWTARQKLPPAGHMRLIKKVESPQPYRASLPWRIWFLFKQYLLVSENLLYMYDEWVWEPLPQSKTWYAHIASSWRLSH
ncbi:MAG: hypothetical protein ACK2U3_03265 [Anaerolineales bacterium]|jgi:hypothetical protein